MQRKESLYPTDWLRIAEKDRQRAAHLLEIHDAQPAGATLAEWADERLR
jgi:hypothetical protein